MVNGEPFYFGNRRIDSVFSHRIFRSQPYLSFIAGARGYTFGQHHIWFFDKDDPFKNFENNTGIYWHDKLDSEGTQWAVRAADIFKTLEWWKFIPDPSIILEGRGYGTEETVACRTPDHSVILIYFPTNTKAQIDLSITGKDQLELTWYKTDESIKTSQTVKSDQNILRPPEGWEDALLIIK